MPFRGTSTTRSLMFFAAVAVAIALTARPSAQADNALRIRTVAIVGTELTITGANFGAAPVVTVGDGSAAVIRSSDTEIVAETQALEPGVYLLHVSRAAGATGDAAASSSVHVR